MKKSLICVFETQDKDEAVKMYKFYDKTHRNVRLTHKKGKGYRIWTAGN